MKILDQIQSISYHVIRVEIGESGSYPASGVVFAKAGDQLDRKEDMEEQDLVQMLSTLPNHSRILLVVSGDQVLSRYSADQNLDLFEEIDEDDFLIQRSVSEDGWQIQSACRQSAIEPLIRLVWEQKHFLVDLSLGPVAITQLEGLLDNAVLQSHHMQFRFAESKLIHIDELQQEGDELIEYGELTISGMSFTAAKAFLLAALLHFFKEGPAEGGDLAENLTESRFFRLFQRTALIILAVFFTLLLTNFLVYSKTQTRLDGMKASGENLSDQIEQIEKLKAQIAEYRNLSTGKAVQPEETYSYYLDVLARTRPSGVWFNRLSIHPLSKKQELNKALELDPASFLLTGETKDPVSLNKLINSLEEMPWVRDIELRNYESLSDRPGAGFELAIKKTE